ncbi:MAG: beta-galactosidase [Solirubrobacteraceae bacterium]|nr:beta-galactosidase [Solirubrobacteraceae bacterium]
MISAVRPRLARGLALALALGAVLTAPAAAAAADPPNPVPVAKGWQYAPDPSDQGDRQGWQTGGAAPPWRGVAVPHVFDGHPDVAGFFGTVGWYRVTFTGPATPAGVGWALHFDQVRRVTRAWLNGRPIGSNTQPYTPFELPAAGLRPGQPNTLVMRVDNHRSSDLREGWWNWGGITRPVSLVPRGPLVLHDVGVLPRKACVGDKCTWSALVDGWLENGSRSDQRPVLTAAMRSPDGTVSRGTATPRTLHPGERLRVRFIVPIHGEAKVWSPEKPQLYDTTITTSAGGRVAQIDHDRLGLRTVDVTDGTLRLNGRALDLRGASIQEDMPGRGPALTDQDIDEIVSELKALHVNVTRAHYLLDKRLLDRFDEAGILVWSQAPVYHRDAQLKTPGQRAYELDVLRRTILAARNHPSVITHSVANELTSVPDERPSTQAWMVNAAQLAHDLDPTLPVSIDVLSYPGIAKQHTYDAFDMLGINSYYGWYTGKPDRSTANLGDLAPYLRAMHAKYPRKALVITEFGAEATENGPADRKQTYAFQSQYIQRYLDIVDRLSFMNGAIYWTAREFAVKPDWDGGAHPQGPRDPIHNKGLISYDGKVKPAFSVAEKAFAQTPLYRDPEAVARAELSHPRSIILSGLLVIFVLALVGALLTLNVMWLRDIWLALRPPEAEVVALRRRAA